MPLPQETGDEQYLDALSKATDRIKKFRPTFVIVRCVLSQRSEIVASALVCSLGVDTHEHDPISNFKITTPCYRRIGESIRSIARPTLFVLEGYVIVQRLFPCRLTGATEDIILNPLAKMSRTFCRALKLPKSHDEHEASRTLMTIRTGSVRTFSENNISSHTTNQWIHCGGIDIHVQCYLTVARVDDDPNSLLKPVKLIVEKPDTSILWLSATSPWRWP